MTKLCETMQLKNAIKFSYLQKEEGGFNILPAHFYMFETCLVFNFLTIEFLLKAKISQGNFKVWEKEEIAFKQFFFFS